MVLFFVLEEPERNGGVRALPVSRGCCLLWQKTHKEEGNFVSSLLILPSEPLRPNPYVLGWEGLKGITLSLPWAPWFLGHIEGTGTVVVVDVVESKWWVVRVLAEYGKKQVWGGRALNKGQIWA